MLRDHYRIVLSYSRDLNKNDINDATEDLTSISQNINSSLKAHFHSKTETRRFQKPSKRKKEWFDQDCDSLYRNLKSSARTLSKSCNVPGKLQYYYAHRKQYKL